MLHKGKVYAESIFCFELCSRLGNLGLITNLLVDKETYYIAL